MSGETLTEFLRVVLRDLVTAHPGLRCNTRTAGRGDAHRTAKPAGSSSLGITVPAGQH
jgi:hypothetical protein